jgi:hypothetical protein
MNNFLFDKKSCQISAILDFDWAQIGLVADETLRSFHSYARLPGPYEQDAHRIALRYALLHRFPSPLPTSSRSVRCDIAEIWDRQLAEAGAKRPSTLEGIETLSSLYTLLDMVYPDMLCNEVKQRSKEKMEQEKEVAEALLIQFLQENQALA